MSLLDLLSASNVYSLGEKDKEFSDSPNTTFFSNNISKDKGQVQEILDSKVVEGHRWYLCKFRGMSDSNPIWKRSADLSCDSLIEEFNDRANQKGQVQEPESQRKNLDTVKEALRCLGGKAFGGAIVEWICENGHDMLQAYGGDRKKLRYCVNGLLSARVNSSIFEKKVYKENGTTKTEWMLSESYMKTLGDATNQNTIVRSIPVQKEEVKQPDSNIASAEDSENSMDDDPSERTATLPEDDDNNSASITTRSSSRQTKTRAPKEPAYSADSNPYARSFNTRTSRDKRRGTFVEKESAYDMEREDYFDISNSIGSSGMELEAIGSGSIEEEEAFLAGDGTGVTPQTYRGMIKVALEALHGQGTFEAISKYIGTRFKDQLSNKAETWKHSIAGCLSVYFARREQKDTSGKVVWTLGEPPKPKRRGRKRDRDENNSPLMETRIHRSDSHNNLTRSSSYSTATMNDYVVPYKPKKKKEEMVMVSADHLEYLEEEVECLKLIVAKRQREEGLVNFHSSSSNINMNPSSRTRQSLQNQFAQSESTSCVACNERHELTMMVNPCGHMFCGSVFCEQSTASRCFICNANITGKLPFRPNRLPATNSKKLVKDTSSSNLPAISPSPSASSTSTSSISSSSRSDPCLTSLSSLASVMSYEIFGDDITIDRARNTSMEVDAK